MEELSLSRHWISFTLIDTHQSKQLLHTRSQDSLGAAVSALGAIDRRATVLEEAESYKLSGFGQVSGFVVNPTNMLESSELQLIFVK